MAWSALFKAELLALSRSWVLRGWLIALGLTEFVVLSGTMMQNRLTPVPASSVLAAHLNGFLLVWSLVIIVLGAGSISMESDVIADSILSRACTRTQYIAAKLLSRALVVLGVYLLSSVIAGYCAWRYAANDLTLSTLSTGITVVGLAVLLLLSLGIALSVFLNNTIFAVVGMLLLWYVASPIFSFLGADYLSPASLTRNLPRILKDPDAPLFLQCTATTTSLTLTFSKHLDPQKAEEPGNYLLEGENGANYTARTAVYDRARTSVILGGLDLPPDGTVKVTVRNVTDAGGSAISPAADSMTATVPRPTQSPGTAAPSGNAGTPSGGSPAPAGSSAASPQMAPASVKSAGRTSPRLVQCVASSSSLKVVFSEEMDPKDAEAVENYIVENPPGRTQPTLAAVYNSGTRTVLLSGLKISLDDPVKVTVRNVRDRHGNPISSRANSAVYSEVTVWKYVLGFGLPTLLVSLLAIAWFSRRDL
jgi:ABC-type transport system involved in multi-copper enzyme maturation permease subunit